MKIKNTFFLADVSQFVNFAVNVMPFKTIQVAENYTISWGKFSIRLTCCPVGILPVQAPGRVPMKITFPRSFSIPRCPKIFVVISYRGIISFICFKASKSIADSKLKVNRDYQR